MWDISHEIINNGYFSWKSWMKSNGYRLWVMFLKKVLLFCFVVIGKKNYIFVAFFIFIVSSSSFEAFFCYLAKKKMYIWRKKNMKIFLFNVLFWLSFLDDADFFWHFTCQDSHYFWTCGYWLSVLIAKI